MIFEHRSTEFNYFQAKTIMRKTKFKILLVFIVCHLLSPILFSQEKLIKIVNKDSLTVQLIERIDPNLKHQKHSKILEEITVLKLKIEETGYLNNTIELIKRNDSLYSLNIQLNKKTDSIHLTLSKILTAQIKNSKETITLPFEHLTNYIEKIKQELESNGQTFAKVYLTKLKLQDSKANAFLKLTLEKPRLIDKVFFKDYPLFPTNFKKRFLKLNKKITFSRKNIQSISNKINTLNFVHQFKKPETLFTNDSTFLYLYLKKKRINQFDGLIGFRTNENGKLIFNGHLDISLKNNFNKGEEISLYWSNNGSDQQDLNLTIATPYIYNSIFSPELNLKIKKQDSTFITTQLKTTVRTNISDRTTLGVILNNETSKNSLILKDPSIQKFSKSNYGLEFTYKKNASYSNFITTQISLSALFGTKTSNNNKTQQTNIHLFLERKLKIYSRSYLYFKNTTRFLKSQNMLFNELFQLGGATSIRGFNENSLFASSYNFSNIEYQFKTAQLSHLYLFSDLGLLENSVSNTKNSLTSFGLGYNYQTNKGLIDISYSLGKTDKTNFELDKGLFHIKFVNIF